MAKIQHRIIRMDAFSKIFRFRAVYSGRSSSKVFEEYSYGGTTKMQRKTYVFSVSFQNFDAFSRRPHGWMFKTFHLKRFFIYDA